jgi:hypothetical protein
MNKNDEKCHLVCLAVSESDIEKLEGAPLKEISIFRLPQRVHHRNARVIISQNGTEKRLKIVPILKNENGWIFFYDIIEEYPLRGSVVQYSKLCSKEQYLELTEKRRSARLME